MNHKSNLLLLLFIGIMISSCAHRKEESKNDNLTVNVATVKSSTTSKQQEFSFISKPFRSSVLSFRVGGPVTNFDAYVGNYYKTDDIIAEIDDRDFLIRKEQSAAKSQQATADYERVKVLYNKNNVAINTYEAANVAYTTAKTAHDTKTNELNDTKLRAPFNGYIGEVFIEKHQDVKPTQAIVSFVDISKLKVEFYVTQEFAFKAQDIKRVNLYFDAMPDKLYQAELVETSKSATSNNLSYLFTAILSNPESQLLAGMSGNVILTISDTDTTNISIPQTALCHNPNDNDYVWILNTTDSTVSKRSVEMGDILSNGNISIRRGLQAGEVIATSGLRFLSNATVVEVAKI